MTHPHLCQYIICVCSQGGTQLLMKVEHIGDNIFDNNQLIDRVFFELSLLVQDTPRTLFSMGEEGYVTARVSDVSVACDGSFCGSNCNYLDRDDSSGHFTCTENGIVCLDGYQYPGTNCTDCVPAPGCCKLGYRATQSEHSHIYAHRAHC